MNIIDRPFWDHIKRLLGFGREVMACELSIKEITDKFHETKGLTLSVMVFLDIFKNHPDFKGVKKALLSLVNSKLRESYREALEDGSLGRLSECCAETDIFIKKYTLAESFFFYADCMHMWCKVTRERRDLLKKTNLDKEDPRWVELKKFGHPSVLDE